MIAAVVAGQPRAERAQGGLQRGGPLQAEPIPDMGRVDRTVQHETVRPLREQGGVHRAEVAAVREAEERHPGCAEHSADDIHVPGSVGGRRIGQRPARIRRARPSALPRRDDVPGEAARVRPAHPDSAEILGGLTAANRRAVAGEPRVEADDVERVQHRGGQLVAKLARGRQALPARSAGVGQQDGMPAGRARGQPVDRQADRAARGIGIAERHPHDRAADRAICRVRAGSPGQLLMVVAAQGGPGTCRDRLFVRRGHQYQAGRRGEDNSRAKHRGHRSEPGFPVPRTQAVARLPAGQLAPRDEICKRASTR